MLVLDTPIRIGKFLYDRLHGGIQGTWDLRPRKIETVISLARSHAGRTIIGTKENDGEQARILPPPIVDSFGFQDSFPSDPALAAAFQKIHELTEIIESLMVANEFFTNRVFMVGEEEASLACTFVPTETPSQFEEKQKKSKTDTDVLLSEETEKENKK